MVVAFRTRGHRSDTVCSDCGDIVCDVVHQSHRFNFTGRLLTAAVRDACRGSLYREVFGGFLNFWGGGVLVLLLALGRKLDCFCSTGKVGGT